MKAADKIGQFYDIGVPIYGYHHQHASLLCVLQRDHGPVDSRLNCNWFPANNPTDTKSEVMILQ